MGLHSWITFSRGQTVLQLHAYLGGVQTFELFLKGGDFSTACAIWDMMLKRDLKPSLRAVNSFCEGLQVRL